MHLSANKWNRVFIFLGISLSLLSCPPIDHSVRIQQEAKQYSVKSDFPAYFQKFIVSPVNPFAKTLRPGQFKKILGGITSHHLLAGEYIAFFFKALKKLQPDIENIILVGPNHESRGRALLAVSERVWKTPFGELYPATQLINKMRKVSVAEIDEEAFYWEHAIGAIVPFVKYYFPQSKILPMVTNFTLPFDRAVQAGKALAALAGEKDLIILSADFVHNKEIKLAQNIDRQSSRRLIHFKQNIRIDSLNKIEMDCRNGLALFFQYLVSRNANGAEILLNTNSGKIIKKDIPVTSYFFVIYGK